MFIGNKGEIFKADDVAKLIWSSDTEGIEDALKRVLFRIIMDRLDGSTAEEIAEAWGADPDEIRALVLELDRLSLIALPFDRVFFDFEHFSMLQFPKGCVW